MSAIFPKKSGGGSFASSPVFGPAAKTSRHGSKAIKDEIVIDFSRSGYEGKHVKATFEGQALAINTDEPVMTLPLAEEAVRIIRGEIAGISRTITPNTKRYREQAVRSYAKGAKWARERYKDRPPGALHTDRLFNDSGSLQAKVRIEMFRAGVGVVTQIDGVRNSHVVTHYLKQLVPAMRNGIGRYPQVKKALTRVLKNTARAFGKGAVRGGALSGNRGRVR